MSSFLDYSALQHCLTRDSANQSSKQAKVSPLKIVVELQPLQGHKLRGDSGIVKVIALAMLIPR